MWLWTAVFRGAGESLSRTLWQRLSEFFPRLSRTGKAPVYEVYTDGGLKRGRGSWAYVIVLNDRMIKENSGMVKRTTCNRMEFQAAIEALQSLPMGATATIYSDSRILVDTMTLWLTDWKLNGWLKSRGQNIPGVDQIKILDQLNQRHSLTWRWVRAHAGISYNERCDQLCIQARAKSNVIERLIPQK